MRLDALDLRILGLLREDARLSYRELAERLGSTTPTVSARVKALEDIGVLRGYRAQLDHATLGGTGYVVTATAAPQQALAAHAAIAALPGTQQALLLPGGRVVALVHMRPPAFTLAHLHERLAGVPGLQTYDASEVIQAAERSDLEDLPENVDVPCHMCKGPIHGEPIRAKFLERAHVFCCRQCLHDFRERFEALRAGASRSSTAIRTKKEPHRHHG